MFFLAHLLFWDIYWKYLKETFVSDSSFGWRLIPKKTGVILSQREQHFLGVANATLPRLQEKWGANFKLIPPDAAQTNKKKPAESQTWRKVVFEMAWIYHPPTPQQWQMKVLVGIRLKKYNPGVEWHPGWRLFIPMTLKRGDSWKHCNSQQITIQKLSLHTWTEIFMVGDHSHLPQNTWLLEKVKFFFHVLLCKKNGMAAMLLGVKFTNRGDLEGKLSSWTRYFF